MLQNSMFQRRYLYKAAWRATSIKFWVSAMDEDQAWKRAERTVMRMEGGIHCMGLELMRTEDEHAEVNHRG